MGQQSKREGEFLDDKNIFHIFSLSTYLQLRLGHLTAPLQIQGSKTIPDGLEQLRPEVHIYSTVWFLVVCLFFFFLLLLTQGLWLTK